jgi:hypothetical protein
VAGDETNDEPCPGARIAHVDHSVRFNEATNSTAVNAPTIFRSCYLRAQFAHGVCGGEYVLGFEKATDPGFSNGACAKDESTMRNRFVAGDRGRAGKRATWMRDHSRHRSPLLVRADGSEGAIADCLGD